MLHHTHNSDFCFHIYAIFEIFGCVEGSDKTFQINHNPQMFWLLVIGIRRLNLRYFIWMLHCRSKMHEPLKTDFLAHDDLSIRLTHVMFTWNENVSTDTSNGMLNPYKYPVLCTSENLDWILVEWLELQSTHVVIRSRFYVTFGRLSVVWCHLVLLVMIILLHILL